jgi:hypothetical protein
MTCGRILVSEALLQRNARPRFPVYRSCVTRGAGASALALLGAPPRGQPVRKGVRSPDASRSVCMDRWTFALAATGRRVDVVLVGPSASPAFDPPLPVLGARVLGIQTNPGRRSIKTKTGSCGHLRVTLPLRPQPYRTGGRGPRPAIGPGPRRRLQGANPRDEPPAYPLHIKMRPVRHDAGSQIIRALGGCATTSTGFAHRAAGQAQWPARYQACVPGES